MWVDETTHRGPTLFHSYKIKRLIPRREGPRYRRPPAVFILEANAQQRLSAPVRTVTAFRKDATEPLSPIDAAWYQLDRRGRSLDIGALLFFDQDLDFQALYELAAKGLATRRRFRSLVVDEPLEVGRPRWEPAPHFRLDAHVHHLAIPEPGDDGALAALVGDLMSQPMDLERPLWELYLLDRPGEGCAVLARIHHCIGDGFALGHLLMSLGVPEEGDWAEEEARQEEHPGWLRRIGEGIAHPTRALDDARQAGRVARALGHLAALPFDSKTVLHRPSSHVRRAGWSEPVELERIKSLGTDVDATVNDVLMAALAGALRTYLIDVGEPVSEITLRAVMPVNLRPARWLEEMSDELGNHFGLTFVSLPVDRATAHERLQVLKAEIDRLKESPEPVVAFGLLQSLGHTPAYFEHLVEDIFLKKASLVASNMPGPRRRLCFAGKPLRDVLFWPPHPGELGLGMSILSYAGKVRIGIRSDAQVLAHPFALARYFRDEFEEMENSGG